MIELTYRSIPDRPKMFGPTAEFIESHVLSLDEVRSYIFERPRPPGDYVTFCCAQRCGSPLGFVRRFRERNREARRTEPTEEECIAALCRFIGRFNSWRSGLTSAATLRRELLRQPGRGPLSALLAGMLLSIPQGGGTLRDVIAAVDESQGALPTLLGLQTGLGGLLARGLIYKESSRYSLTEAGHELIRRACHPIRYPTGPETRSGKILALVSQALGSLEVVPEMLDNVTLTEARNASRSYREMYLQYARVGRRRESQDGAGAPQSSE